jgi:alpha-tubulin suppressor-like RCC1 family protein
MLQWMRRRDGPGRRWAAAALPLSAVALALASLPAPAGAEQSSQPGSAAAAGLDVGSYHSCALLSGGSVRCWGHGAEGELGYGSTATIGDDEAPGSVAPVYLGPGRAATAISAGAFHTCALLDDGSVRCWGFGGDGRLGYGTEANVGDDESPGSRPPVDLGAGRTARAISAGTGHTCALLDNATVRCWGYGENGALGYGNAESIGDDESPGSVGPVDLGEGRTATAISAGNDFTCAVLDDRSVRCWGLGLDGRLGYGNTDRIGDDELPSSVGPLDLGAGRSAAAISAGAHGACAVLDDSSVRCWGEGREGQLGYGDGKYIGDTETPGSVGPVDLGSGRTAEAISAGRHTCAVLNLGAVRCWGTNRFGQLGYGHTASIGETETPAAAGPVDLGAGRKATAISAGELHTCARLDDDSVRCWGFGGNGRLGLCSVGTVGDDELPASTASVPLLTARCPPRPAGRSGPPGGAYTLSDPLLVEAARRRGWRSCISKAARHTRREIRRARRSSGSRRARARRHIQRHRRSLRRRCLRRFGRKPGRVRGLRAETLTRRTIRLTFEAAGSDGARDPAARVYLVKQSRRPIRGQRAFARAGTLCRASCRFPSITRVGARLELTITRVRPRTTYYFAIAARDNVSRRLGPRTRAVRVRTP